MNDELKKEVIDTLNTLREDAEMALDGRWDKSDHGFESQIMVIDQMLNKLT